MYTARRSRNTKVLQYQKGQRSLLPASTYAPVVTPDVSKSGDVDRAMENNVRASELSHSDHEDTIIMKELCAGLHEATNDRDRGIVVGCSENAEIVDGHVGTQGRDCPHSSICWIVKAGPNAFQTAPIEEEVPTAKTKPIDANLPGNILRPNPLAEIQTRPLVNSFERINSTDAGSLLRNTSPGAKQGLSNKYPLPEVMLALWDYYSLHVEKWPRYFTAQTP